jgi:hypothetical protein
MINEDELEELKGVIAEQRQELILLTELRSQFDISFSQIRNDSIVRLRDVKENDSVSSLCIFIKENYYRMIMDWNLKELDSGSVESVYDPLYFDLWDIKNVFEKALRILEDKINDQIIKISHNLNILENIRLKRKFVFPKLKQSKLVHNIINSSDSAVHSEIPAFYKPF